MAKSGARKASYNLSIIDIRDEQTNLNIIKYKLEIIMAR